MIDFVTLRCPYCDEEVEIYVDPQERGVLVQDCEVCCRPWELTIERDQEGDPIVHIAPL